MVFGCGAAEYQAEFYKLFGQILNGMAACDPITGLYGNVSMSHHGPIRNVTGPVPLDQQPRLMEHEVSVPYETIRSTDVEELTEIIAQVGLLHVEELDRFFIESFSEITEASGNSYDAGGQKLSFDLILDMVERMDMRFDEDGNPIFPHLMMSPKSTEILMKQPPTDAQNERLGNIIRNKKESFYAQKRTRRLF